MEKEKIYQQIYKDQRYINIREKRILCFQKLLQSKKYNEHKDIKAFINGYISWLKKDYQNAEKQFIKAIEIDAKFAYPYNGLGTVYDDLKDNDKAIEYYNKAIEIDDKFAYPYNGLGTLFNQPIINHTFTKQIQKKCIS